MKISAVARELVKLNGKVRACFRSPWVKGDGLHSLAGEGCHVFHRIQVTLKKFWVLRIKDMPETRVSTRCFVTACANVKVHDFCRNQLSLWSGQLTDATKAVALLHCRPPILNPRF